MELNGVKKESRLVTLHTIGKERTASNGQKFISWKVILKTGEYKRLKFTRKCATLLPNSEGRYDVTSYLNDINLSEDDYGEVYWVANIVDVTPSERITNLKEDDLPF